LLLSHIFPIFSIVAPCQPGAALRDLGKLFRTRDTRAWSKSADSPTVDGSAPCRSVHMLTRLAWLFVLAQARPRRSILVARIDPGRAVLK